MRKLWVFILLFFVLLSVSAKTKKVLNKEIKFCIDSIILRTPAHIMDEYKYYRFYEGAIVVPSDTVMIGVFGVLERIHFVSFKGIITSTSKDKRRGKPSRKTLKELLLALKEPW